jgi:hypothetical protein
MVLPTTSKTVSPKTSNLILPTTSKKNKTTTDFPMTRIQVATITGNLENGNFHFNWTFK